MRAENFRSGLRKTDKITVPPFGYYQYKFHDALIRSPRLLVIGYGGGDTYINSLVLQMRRIHGEAFKAAFITKSTKASLRDYGTMLPLVALGVESQDLEIRLKDVSVSEDFVELPFGIIYTAGFPLTNSVEDRLLSFFEQDGWEVQYNSHSPLGQYMEPLLSYLAKFEPAATAVTKALSEKYRLDPPPTHQIAIENFGDATKRFAGHLALATESGATTTEQIRSRIVQPDLLKSLQRELLDASETKDELSHEVLARILAVRVVVDETSRRNLLLRLAGEMISRLTGAQLRQLGLIYTLFYVTTTEDTRDWSAGQFLEWLGAVERYLAPYADLLTSMPDIDYLSQMGAVSIHRVGGLFSGGEVFGYSRLLAPLNFALQSLSKEFSKSALVMQAFSMMESDLKEGKRGLDAVTMTAVGLVIGACAQSVAAHEAFGLDSSWETV
jgi:hypothetical protein